MCFLVNVDLPLFFLLLPPPPRSPLFPYTTLFRSHSLRLVLPRRTTPALRNRVTRKASAGGLAPTRASDPAVVAMRSEEHTSELQSRGHLVCRLLLEKKKKRNTTPQLNKGAVLSTQ